MPDKPQDIESVHRDADFKATGADKAKTLQESFANHGLTYAPGGEGALHRAKTHSHAIRMHPLGIAKSLLGLDKIEMVQLDESRPLIDLLQEATFRDDDPMQWVGDKYALRMLLRKAHCFRLDAETSRMVVDFSVAIASDLEAVRHLAIPPFPVTWFEIDNIARLKRCKELGIKLTETASRDDVCKRIGWLISPATDLVPEGVGYYVTYCTVIGQGVMIAPLSFFWHTGDAGPPNEPKGPGDVQRVCFGMPDSGVGKIDAFPCCTPFHLHYQSERNHSSDVKRLMFELSGELRAVWGLLLALGAGHLGAETVTTAQTPPAGPHPVAKGKPLLPLEHKVLTIKLGKRRTVEKVAAMAITGIKKRRHEVRGHFRTKLNTDGSVKWRIPIKSHERGDERLGRIEKVYRVQK